MNKKNNIAMEKEFIAVPDKYRNECKKQGTIESLYYKVPNLENGKNKKHFNVYLPYCYDASDINTMDRLH